MDCDKILNELIKPSVITAIKAVLTLGLYNYTMNQQNVNTYYEYRMCKNLVNYKKRFKL